MGDTASQTSEHGGETEVPAPDLAADPAFFLASWLQFRLLQRPTLPLIP